MLDFRQITLVLFRKTPLKAQNDYIFYKFGGVHGPFGPLLATPMFGNYVLYAIP